MKIKVHLKDPDGFYDCVKEAVAEEVSSLSLDDDEREHVTESRLEKTWKKLDRFVSYKEYVTIEFDTDANTAVVVERAER